MQKVKNRKWGEQLVQCCYAMARVKFELAALLLHDKNQATTPLICGHICHMREGIAVFTLLWGRGSLTFNTFEKLALLVSHSLLACVICSLFRILHSNPVL